MTNKYEDIIRKGLPGGPNEEITYTSGFSTMGYKRFSPDVNNPFNIIPSGRITMEDVDFPVTGIDNLGNESIMFPDEEYSFPGNMVLELPHRERPNVEAYGNAFAANNAVGYSGHLNSKNLDVHGTYIKPLQNIAAKNGMLDLSLDLKYQRGNNEFSLSPSAFLGKDPRFGINVGYKRSFQDGGQTEYNLVNPPEKDPNEGNVNWITPPVPEDEKDLTPLERDIKEFIRQKEDGRMVDPYLSTQLKEESKLYPEYFPEGFYEKYFPEITQEQMDIINQEREGPLTIPGQRYGGSFQPGGELQSDEYRDGYSYSDDGNIYTEIISDSRPNDDYEYKRVKDKNTGDINYFTRKKGANTWGTAGAEGSRGYRGITDVFGEDKTGWATSQDKRDFYNEMLTERAQKEADEKIAAENPITSTDEQTMAFINAYFDQQEGKNTSPKKVEPLGPNSMGAAFASKENQQRAAEHKRRVEAGEIDDIIMTDKQWQESMARERQNALNRGVDFVKDITGVNAAKSLYDKGASQVIGDLANSAADLVGGAAEGIYEGVDYLVGDGSFDMSDTNWMTGNKYGSGLDTVLDIASMGPAIGFLGKGAKLANYADDAKNIYQKAVKPISNVLNRVGETKVLPKSFNTRSLSDFNKNFMKKDLISSSNPAMQQNIDNVFNIAKKAGLSNNPWGAATAYGMYGAMPSVDRVIQGEGDISDALKVGTNFIPGANVANAAGLPAYATKTGLKILDKFQQNGGQVPRAQNGTEMNQIDEFRNTQEKKDAIPEPTQAYLNDLYISDQDLELLNARPENIQYDDLSETDKNKMYYSSDHDKKISAKEYQDHYGGFNFYDLSAQGQKEANPYFCDPSKGCLASAFDSYDELVGQRYRSQDFMSEAKLKKALDLQSLPSGYYAEYDEQGNLTFTKNGQPVSQRTHDWIMNQGDYFKSGKRQIYIGHDEETGENIYAKNPDGSFMYGDNYDFTADSWDIHSVVKRKGGKNIFTKNPEDYTKGEYDDYVGRHMLGEYKGKTMADLSESELKNIYSQITPGTIIGFGDNHAGSNEKDGMAGSSHSAIVVGFDKRGVPIIYDYGNYVPLDGDTMYGFRGISNISVPKQMEGKNLEWAKDQGMYSGKDPKNLDLKINSIVEAGGDEDEIVPFYEALKENKNSLMNDLKIRPKHYDMFSKLLIGISMEETEGGSGMQHNIEQALPGTAFQESVGLTQLMWSNIEGDDRLRKIANKYNIREIGDLKDPKKSAIASMIYASRNMSSAKKNYRKGKGQKGLRTYYPANSNKQKIKSLVGKDPTFDGYTFRTEEGVDVDFFTGSNTFGIGWDKSIEDIQSQFDEIAPGKYTVREEDGEYVVDKVTEGNSELTPEQMFIYNWNSPNTLLKGDAQGGANYVNNVMGYYEQLQSGGEISSEDIEAKQQALEEELANLNAFQLQPAQLLKMQTQLYDTYNENVPRKFRIGGPKLSPELALYKDYIVGKDESQKAQKNYDKLNRVYYREAKVNNMHPSNYIMTTMIS